MLILDSDHDNALTVGQHGVGTLNITNGGAVSVAGGTYVAYLDGSSGTIDFGSAGGTLTTRSLRASPADLTGTGTVHTRGLVSDVDLVFDAAHGGDHTFMLNDQPGRNIAIQFDISGAEDVGTMGVGYRGAGSMAVRDGVAVHSRVGYVATEAGSTGTVTVDGAGSAWNTSSYLFVGNRGGGTLRVTGGGSVSAEDQLWIGNESGSTGEITVDGAGSALDINNCIFVGRYGSATLNVTDGATVYDHTGYMGENAGSAGIARVDGVGSTWTHRRSLYVGRSGAGTLDISHGGMVVIGESLIIDDDEDGNGCVNMSTGGMLALHGAGELSIRYFLAMVEGTDAIRYWDSSAEDWANILYGMRGKHYQLTYLTEGELEGYTLLTVGTLGGDFMPGDVDGDGFVASGDLDLIRANWNTIVSMGSRGDANNDGVVDSDDLDIVRANWGAAAAAVPEPSVFLLGLVGALVLACRRRAVGAGKG